MRKLLLCSFFVQAEDGIRDLVRSRGLGDVYKRQVLRGSIGAIVPAGTTTGQLTATCADGAGTGTAARIGEFGASTPQ